MFDDLVVMSEGRVMYHGPAGKVRNHLRSKGYAMPADTNPAEFAIDLVSIDYTSKVKPWSESGTERGTFCLTLR